MITLKQFFEKYLTYFILGLLIFISFYDVISNLISIDELIELFDDLDNPWVKNTQWSLISSWFIEVISFIFIGVVSIITLVKTSKNNENRLYTFNFISFTISIIMFEMTLCAAFVLIEFGDSSSSLPAAIMNLLFFCGIGVLFLLSYVIKFKSNTPKFILTLIGYSFMLILFITSTLNIISSQSSLSSTGSLLQIIAFVFLSLMGIVFTTFYMAINCTSGKIVFLKENKELEKKLMPLKEMVDKGIITQEEYETKKNELLENS